jgi:hypothetical protein
MCKNTEIREELVQLNERIRELEKKLHTSKVFLVDS